MSPKQTTIENLRDEVGLVGNLLDVTDTNIEKVLHHINVSLALAQQLDREVFLRKIGIGGHNVAS